jgi:glyoxylase-like metal-dependent hydrolase (beta-lactamase superfamily II)
MQVKTTKVGSLQTNCYVIKENNNCIVIDPGDDFLKIKDLIGNDRLIAVLLTHRHDDHVGALKDVVRYYGCPVYDRKNLEERRYDFCGIKIEVIYTPGHTDDSISYYLYEYGFMFVGDFIFRGTIGRCDLPTGDFEVMKKSIEKMKKYSERTILYPGHDYQTTLGEEIRNNPYLRGLK